MNDLVLRVTDLDLVSLQGYSRLRILSSKRVVGLLGTPSGLPVGEEDEVLAICKDERHAQETINLIAGALATRNCVADLRPLCWPLSQADVDVLLDASHLPGRPVRAPFPAPTGEIANDEQIPFPPPLSSSRETGEGDRFVDLSADGDAEEDEEAEAESQPSRRP